MAILTDKSLDFISSSEEQTLRLGIRLGELMQNHDVICLSGELGAGKTLFARGIGRGWGSAVRVTSPTFTLINQYPRARDGLVLYHVDCYRLSEKTGDIVTTGIEDIWDADGAIIIEWPERIARFLPDDRLEISLRYVSDTRRGMQIRALGQRAEQLLSGFRRSAFGV
jgi:tRNA threonylcarbamoyladenosine biosynthesis protein TsaE